MARLLSSLFAVLLMGASLRAAPLVSWKEFQPGRNIGTYTGGPHDTVTLEQVPGPQAGQKALALRADLTDWGGVWATAAIRDLSRAGGIRFKARSLQDTELLVGFHDVHQARVEAAVRVHPGDWQEFVLPLAAFRKAPRAQSTPAQDPAFDPSLAQNLTFAPRFFGKNEIIIGPVEATEGVPEASANLVDVWDKAGNLVVQDFEFLGAGAYGTFGDGKISSLKLNLQAGEQGQGLAFRYKLAEGGWCGAWIRAGDAWGGQDWRGARRLTLRVHSLEPVALEIAFTDTRQNAYVAPAVRSAVRSAGGGWTTLEVPFEGFVLNPTYQPPQAEKGAPLDLSRVETFNISVQGAGKGEFTVDAVTLHRK